MKSSGGFGSDDISIGSIRMGLGWAKSHIFTTDQCLLLLKFDPGTQKQFQFSDHRWDIEPSAYAPEHIHLKSWNISVPACALMMLNIVSEKSNIAVLHFLFAETSLKVSVFLPHVVCSYRWSLFLGEPHNYPVAI